MNGLTVLVADDEPLARRRLCRLLNRLGWVGRVTEAADVAEACRQATSAPPDILLLDIQMPGGDGFVVLEQLAPATPAVVFVTAFDHYALRAFEANAVDYLTKPIDPTRFDLAMERARRTATSHHQYDRIVELQETIASLKQALNERARTHQDFWVKVREGQMRIAHDSVLRFQAERDYVRLHTTGAAYLYHEPLTSLERRLDSTEFLRVHRSHLVRCDHISRIKPAPFGSLVLVLHDGTEIRVGRTYAPALRSRMGHK